MIWGIPVDIHAYFREGPVTGRFLHRAFHVPLKRCSHCKDVTSHPLAGNPVTTAISATGTSMWDDLWSSGDSPPPIIRTDGSLIHRSLFELYTLKWLSHSDELCPGAGT